MMKWINSDGKRYIDRMEELFIDFFEGNEK